MAEVEVRDQAERVEESPVAGLGAPVARHEILAGGRAEPDGDERGRGGDEAVEDDGDAARRPREEHTDQARVDLSLMEQMIEDWTLRRAPTKGQREAGQRGDLVPLARDAIEQLPPAVGQFIRAEIEKRRDVVAPATLLSPDGDDFRHANLSVSAGVDTEPQRRRRTADHARSGGDRADRLEHHGA